MYNSRVTFNVYQLCLRGQYHFPKNSLCITALFRLQNQNENLDDHRLKL